MSLWRKRLSIKSDDLSIKSEKAMREVQRLGQEIEQEPVAWQWLTTANFRKKLPKDAEKGAWNPLYTTPQPKQEQDEPVAYRYKMPVEDDHWVWNYCTYPDNKDDPRCEPLHTTPQQRTWVGLTEEEKIKLWDRAEKRGAYQGVPSFIALIQEVEAKLRSKNHDVG